MTTILEVSKTALCNPNKCVRCQIDVCSCIITNSIICIRESCKIPMDKYYNACSTCINTFYCNTCYNIYHPSCTHGISNEYSRNDV